jgi:hypothetical protein
LVEVVVQLFGEVEFVGSEERSMPSEGRQELRCYNRGCGQKFDPNENGEGNKDIFSNMLYV